MRILVVFQRAALAAASTLLFTSILFRQAKSRSIVGMISDLSRETVANCNVVAMRVSTEVNKKTNTDISGEYRITYLLPGLYVVIVKAPNFKRAVETGL